MKQLGRQNLYSEVCGYFQELFLECVEEVRRDISKRKATTIGMYGNLNGGKGGKA